MKNNSKMTKLFNSKIFWMIVSLLSALLLWIYVTGTNTEKITRDFANVDVVLTGQDTLLSSREYVVTDLDTVKVFVRISGTRNNIGTLSDDDIKAVVDVSKITSMGKFTVSYALQYPEGVDASGISIVSASPSTVSFYVSKESSKSFSVKGAFVGGLAEGYIAGELEFEPDTVTVSGPESILSQIDHVWATIGGDNVNKTKSADVPFVLRDAENNELSLDGLAFDTDTVRVTLPVNAKKEVPLSVSVIEGSGAVEGTYVITYEPATITISGDTTIVDGINKIDLGTVDLTDFTSAQEFTFPITLDNGVENVTGTTEAKVTVNIEGLETKQLTISNLSFINCPSAYTAEILTRSIEVRIRAAADILGDIRANDLRAVADLSDISATGDVSVPVKIYVAGYTSEAGAVGDYTITVNIKG